MKREPRYRLELTLEDTETGVVRTLNRRFDTNNVFASGAAQALIRWVEAHADSMIHDMTDDIWEAAQRGGDE